MKIKDNKKREWMFFPHENSKLNKGKCYKFKYKSDLMHFLNKNISEAINGEVYLKERGFGYSGSKRMWFVWYNDKAYLSGANLKVELRQLYFRGQKFIHKIHKIEKVDKKYFAFSDKVISLMCNIQNDDGIILPKDAKRLVELYKKRGFKDFEPSEEDSEYINGYIAEGIDFYHWSDRCNWLRTKTVIEYFKRNNLI